MVIQMASLGVFELNVPSSMSNLTWPLLILLPAIDSSKYPEEKWSRPERPGSSAFGPNF